MTVFIIIRQHQKSEFINCRSRGKNNGNASESAQCVQIVFVLRNFITPRKMCSFKHKLTTGAMIQSWYQLTTERILSPHSYSHVNQPLHPTEHCFVLKACYRCVVIILYLKNATRFLIANTSRSVDLFTRGTSHLNLTNHLFHKSNKELSRTACVLLNTHLYYGTASRNLRGCFLCTKNWVEEGCCSRFQFTKYLFSPVLCVWLMPTAGEL